MNLNAHYLIFGGVLWAFTLFGFALHVADVHRRQRLGTMELKEYNRSRPIEWMLAVLLLFAATSASMGGIAIWGMGMAGVDAIARFQVLVGAAVTAAALSYVGMCGKSWVIWAQDDFIKTPGATSAQAGKVFVNVALEAKHDSDIIRRMAWPVYAVGCMPLVFAAFNLIATVPMASVVAMFAMLCGMAIVTLLLASFTPDKEDDDW